MIDEKDIRLNAAFAALQKHIAILLQDNINLAGDLAVEREKTNELMAKQAAKNNDGSPK